MKYTLCFADMDIFRAIKKQNIGQIKSILSSQNIDIDVKKGGQTPLLVATAAGNPNILKILLDLGADVNIRSSDFHQKTALHLACKYCTVEGVALLLRSGAEIDAQDHYGNSPLYKACSKGRLDIVTLLVKNDARINLANANNNSPLHAAAANGHINVVNLLLESGCDKLVKNKNGDTPYTYAVKNKYTDIADLLITFNYKEFERKKVASLQIRSTPCTQSSGLPKASLDINCNENTIVPIEFTSANLKALEIKLASLEGSRNDLKHILEADSLKLQKSKEAVKQAEADLKKALVRYHHTERELNLVNEKITNLSTERDDLKQDLYNKNKARTENAKSMDISDMRLYECPICFEVPLPPLNIFQCEQGHIYCEKCKAQPNMTACPQCRVSIEGLSIRCRHMEDLILKKFM